MAEQLVLRGSLKGHNGWVTQIATTPQVPDMILSASRDKTIIQWQLTEAGENFGYAKRALTGHSHFVSDVVVSSDGQFALSGSWDSTMRLWDLNTGVTTRQFKGHTKDILSVAFSADNRQIVSGSRDKTIKLWNTLAECKYTIQDDCHSEWVVVSDSVPTRRTQSSSLVDGISTSRYGTSLTVSSRPTILDTTDTSTQSPSPLMVLSLLPEDRTARPCFGILMRTNISTHWTVEIRSTPSPSHLTDTGSVPLPVIKLRSGTSKVSRLLMRRNWRTQLIMEWFPVHL